MTEKEGTRSIGYLFSSDRVEVLSVRVSCAGRAQVDLRANQEHWCVGQIVLDLGCPLQYIALRMMARDKTWKTRRGEPEQPTLNCKVTKSKPAKTTWIANQQCRNRATPHTLSLMFFNETGLIVENAISTMSDDG